MRKALASVVIVAFAGLLCTSLLALFSGTKLGTHYTNGRAFQNPYTMTY